MKVYEPEVKVTLFKTIQRKEAGEGVPVSERFTGIGKRVDLSPYIGEGATISTRKSVREPAGAFSLQLLDKPFIGYLDVPPDQLPSEVDARSAESIYGIIEPMDIIEVRMRHGGEAVQGKPPVIMRGFVSSVGRSEAMGGDGRPVRTVRVQGQDYGKLWQMLQIMYLPGYIVGQDTISAFKLFEKFGVGFKIAQPGTEFVSEVLLKVINPYLELLMPPDSPAVKTLSLDEDQLRAHGTTSLTGPQNFEGTFYDLFRTYLDVGTWNELFLEDREDGVFLVYRPNPYKNANGNMIVEDAATPETVEVSGEDIVSINVARTDGNVANYFWVRSPRFESTQEVYRRQYTVTGDQKKTVLLGDYPNCKQDLYGIRAMFVDTQMGGDEISNFGTGLPESDLKKQQTDQVSWIDYKRNLLVEFNKDNVIFESGEMRLRGNEQLRAGAYARLTRGQFFAEYYAFEVAHDWIWGQGYFTTLRVDRGTGFIERAKRGGGQDSPYYAELMKR